MTDIIKQLIKDHAAFKKQFQAQAQTALKQSFSDFFSANPTITSINWTQYTPYFNDGEECYFTVYDMYFNVKNLDAPEDQEASGDEDEGYSTYFWDNNGKNVDPVPDERKAFKKFSELVRTLPDEIFLDAFGNHVKMVATAEGFNVEEYEHE